MFLYGITHLTKIFIVFFVVSVLVIDPLHFLFLFAASLGFCFVFSFLFLKVSLPASSIVMLLWLEKEKDI